jgi:eukaryotic-like serine/threonine-protein kinase
VCAGLRVEQYPTQLRRLPLIAHFLRKSDMFDGSTQLCSHSGIGEACRTAEPEDGRSNRRRSGRGERGSRDAIVVSRVDQKPLDGCRLGALGGQIGLAGTGRAMLTNPLSEGVVIKDTYRVVRRLGGGGMGEVYEAEHLRLAGRYAIKRLLPEAGLDPAAFRRFQREAEIASSLQHPNIVQVIDFDTMPDGAPYLVMELLKGQDLDVTLRQFGKLSPQRAADIVEQTAAGLSAAHDKGIVHRDLKPANIFVVPLPGTRTEIIKLVDFGISKILAAKTKLTADASLIGTPQYMSPEQATGIAVGPETDQFALALIAREMLTGLPAFNGDSFAVLLYKIVHEQPPSLAELGFVTHPEVEAVLNRAMSKRPSDRYASVAEFSSVFRRAVDAWLLGATVGAGSATNLAFAQTALSPVPHPAPVQLPQPISALPAAADGATMPAAGAVRAARGSKRWLSPFLIVLLVAAALVTGVVAIWRSPSKSASVAATPSVAASLAAVLSATSMHSPVASGSPEASAMTGPVVASASSSMTAAVPSSARVRKRSPAAVEHDVAPPNPYLKKER